MTDTGGQLTPEARALLNEAGRSWNEGRLDIAAEKCERALEMVPDHAGGLNLAGVIAHRRGHLAEAERRLARAVELEPGNPEYRQNLAVVMLAAGRARHAIRQLDSVLESEPGNLGAQELRAEALDLAGEPEQAIAAWRAVRQANPGHPGAETRLTDLVGRIDPGGTNPVVDELIESLLGSERVEPNLLAIPVARRVMARHGIDSEDAQPSTDAMAEDPLLVRALRTLYFTEPAFDRVLVGLRRNLLLGCREQGRMPGRWQRLIGALAVHNLRNEYVHPAREDELSFVEELAGKLESLLRDDEAEAAALAGPLMLTAMYRAPQSLHAADRLAAMPAAAWPEAAAPLIRMAFTEPAREAELAASLPVLKPIGEGTTSLVRQMYEEHPYPRWERLGPVSPGTVAERVAMQLPDYRPPAFAGADRVDVLIAGCGTGRHALRAAMEYTNARVLAVDISRRSLGYAARRAEELGVTNLELMQADLFDLAELDRQFHVVETIGTLETLDDPAAGWRVLNDVLAPGGLMYVGSYSEVARRPVVRARERIRDLGLGDSDEDMRAFRERLFQGELGEDGRMLLHCGDLYSLSGCRDFLFHVREKRFRIRELSELWQSLGLRFLGFHPVRQPLREAWAQRFPDDPLARDLGNWMRLEEGEPDEFCRLMNLSMLYYWVEKREG